MKQCDVLITPKGKDRSPKMLLGAISRNKIQLSVAKTHPLLIKSLHWQHQYKHSLRWTRSKQPTTWIEKHGQKNQEQVEKRGNWGQLKPRQVSHHRIKEGMRRKVGTLGGRPELTLLGRWDWGTTEAASLKEESLLGTSLTLTPPPLPSLLDDPKQGKHPPISKSRQIKATPHKTHQE